MPVPLQSYSALCKLAPDLSFEYHTRSLDYRKNTDCFADCFSIFYITLANLCCIMQYCFLQNKDNLTCYLEINLEKEGGGGGGGR